MTNDLNHYKVLVLHPNDNVAVALTPLAVGETVHVEGSPLATSVLIRMPIPTGHKVALTRLSAGEQAIKYGQPIGVVTHDIATGEHVHVHNLASSRAG